jgi:hypothetical protein
MSISILYVKLLNCKILCQNCYTGCYTSPRFIIIIQYFVRSYLDSDRYTYIRVTLLDIRGTENILEHRKKLSVFSPQANYTDRATAACLRS